MSDYSKVPQRETYPLVSHDDTLFMVFRDHITPTARPVLYVKGITAARIRVDDGHTLDDRPGIRVVDYSVGGGDNFIITVNGVATTRAEGVDFGAVTSNEITALNIRDAINAAYTTGNVVAELVGANVYLNLDHTVTTLTISTSDAAAWNSIGFMTLGAVQTLSNQESVSIDLPNTTPFDTNNKVSILNVLSGRVSADLRSPIPVRTYFKQPTTLRATTGHPGGWPTAP